MHNTMNLHLTYNKEGKIVECQRQDLYKKVKDIYHIAEEEEIIFFEHKKGETIREVELNDLKDCSKYIVKKTQRKKNSKIKTSYPEILAPAMVNNIPSTSTVPTEEEVVFKIKDYLEKSSRFSSPEKKLGAAFLDSALKRKSENEGKQQSNKRVQVSPYELMVVCPAFTQTDNLKEYVTANGRDKIPTKEVIDRGKKIASEIKPNTEKARKNMSESYEKRRSDMKIKNPPISNVREQYPLLFCLAEIRNELDRIFFEGKCNIFMENVSKCATAILSMADDKDPLVLKIRQNLKTAQNASQSMYIKSVGSILMLCAIMKESPTFLHLEDKPGKKDNYPRIESTANANSIFTTKPLHVIKAEGITLCQTTDFVEAVLCLVAAYFIFDIQYNPEIDSTLIVMEKIYLECTETTDVDEYQTQIVRMIQCKTKAV